MVMGMRGIGPDLEGWQLDLAGVRSRMHPAPAPRERERRRALRLLCRGLTASGTAQALGRDAHTIGRRAAAFGEGGPRFHEGRLWSLDIRADRGFPPALGGTQQAELTGAVQELPGMPGMEMANWNWKVVRQFVSKRFGIGLSRSACLNYPHRLGFVLKRLVKADEQKREAFAAEYAALSDEAWRTGAKIFFAGEAHFRADAELRGKWVPKGEPAPVSTRAGFGGLDQPELWRKGRLLLGSSAVCLETGESLPSRKRGWSGWTWRGTATPEPRLPSWSGCGRGAPGRWA